MDKIHKYKGFHIRKIELGKYRHWSIYREFYPNGGNIVEARGNTLKEAKEIIDSHFKRMGKENN